MDFVPTAIEPALARLAMLCERCHVKTLDLFGSALTGRFDPDRSDFDFLVRFEDGPRLGFADDYFTLHQALEDLFGRSIDLVEEPAMRNPFFRRRVLATRRRLYPLGMISQEAAKHVWDAHRAAETLLRITSSRTSEELENDELLRLAVERGFEVLGESFVRLRRDAPETAAAIPSLAQAIAFRNIIAHQYDDLNLSTVWNVVQNQLPTLLEKLKELLKKVPGEEGSDQ